MSVKTLQGSKESDLGGSHLFPNYLCPIHFYLKNCYYFFFCPTLLSSYISGIETLVPLIVSDMKLSILSLKSLLKYSRCVCGRLQDCRHHQPLILQWSGLLLFPQPLGLITEVMHIMVLQSSFSDSAFSEHDEHRVSFSLIDRLYLQSLSEHPEKHLAKTVTSLVLQYKLLVIGLMNKIANINTIVTKD